MAQTSVTNVHYNTLLADLSIGYHPAGLMAEDIFTPVNVQHESDKYAIFDRTDAFRMIDDVRPDGMPAKVIDFGWTYSGYVTEEHALSVRLTDRERDNADNLLRLQLLKVNGAQGILMLNQENRISTLMNDTTQYAATNQVNVGAVPANQWNNASFSGSIEQIFDNAKEAGRIQMGGLAFNRLIIPKAVAMVVKRDAKIRDLIKYTHQDLLVDGDLPPMLWGMKTMIPAASAASSTSIEGGTAPAMVDLWGKNAWMVYRVDAGSTDTPNFGYIFRCKGLQVQSWHNDEVGATFYRPSYNQVEKVVSPYAGYIMTGTIA